MIKHFEEKYKNKMIPEESLKKMLKSNEDKLSMLDMTVLYEFVEKGE